MAYYCSTIVDMEFERAEEKIRVALQEQGFGILTEIDVQATLKKKLNADFRKYKILGACNPSFAHKALLEEDKIGLMLPCNVILQESGEGRTEVAAVDPVATMSAVGNESLAGIADQVRAKLQTAIRSLESVSTTAEESG